MGFIGILKIHVAGAFTYNLIVAQLSWKRLETIWASDTLGRVFLKSLVERKWRGVVKDHEGFQLSVLQKSAGIVMW